MNKYIYRVSTLSWKQIDRNTDSSAGSMLASTIGKEGIIMIQQPPTLTRTATGSHFDETS